MKKQYIFALIICLAVAALLFYNDQANKTPTRSSTEPAKTENGWYKYTNSNLGFSLNYPSNWLKTGDDNSESPAVYFSNQNVGAPLEMTPGGIFLGVSRDPDTYKTFEIILDSYRNGKAVSGLTEYTNTTKISLSGQEAYKYIAKTQTGADTENFYTVNYSLKQGSYIYTLMFVTLDKPTADQNMALYDEFASSFKLTQ